MSFKSLVEAKKKMVLEKYYSKLAQHGVVFHDVWIIYIYIYIYIYVCVCVCVCVCVLGDYIAFIVVK